MNRILLLLSFAILTLLLSACSHRSIQEVYWGAGTSVALDAERKGNLREAEEEFRVALSRAERELDEEKIASSLHNLGAFYRRQNRLADSIHYLKKALKTEENVSGPTSERTGRTLAELAAAYLMEGNFINGHPIAKRLESTQSYYTGKEAVFVEMILEGYKFDEEQYNKEVSRLKPLAEAGDPESQYELAGIYSYNPKAEELLPTILNLYNTSAQKGFSDSQYYLGVMYDKGRGVENNDMKAREWYRIAAENNHKIAQFNYAVFLIQGRGGAKNKDEAYEWIRKSAAQGYPSAQRALR